MNPVIKGQIDQFLKANPHEDLTEAEAFEVLTIHAVENGLLTENIEPFSAHLKGSEFGLDGVAILIQGEICRDIDEAEIAFSTGKRHSVEFHFFQAKTGENLDYGALSKFFDAIFAFLDGTFLNPTDQLSDLMDVKEMTYGKDLRTNPNIKCFFSTTGPAEVSNESKKLISLTETRLEGLSLFENVEIRILGAKSIQSGYRSATQSISTSIEIEKYVTLPKHPSVSEAFLGVITASELLKLITVQSDGEEIRQINRSVFYDNIRDYDTKSAINKEILRDLKDTGQQSFVFKNNGITVVAKEINRTSDKFQLDDYQIVNGCQTSNIIFEAGDTAKGVAVPFRLIGSKDAEFVSSIIIGTNRQNQVRDDQFWALKPFMKDLEEYCQSKQEEDRLFIERRENQYRDASVERTRIVKPSELMKSIAAMFLFQPHRAARDYRGIRSEFQDRIFLDDHNVEIYHLAALANYKFEFAIRNNRVPKEWRIYKYFVLYALGFEATNNSNIFNQSKKLQSKSASYIRGILSDETIFNQHVADCSNVLDKLTSESSAATREQIRDYIRSDSVTKMFIGMVYE